MTTAWLESIGHSAGDRSSISDAGRRCVIVSPHFPPSTLAGVHRARHLAKHLPAHGWKPKIICVDPRHHTERLDPGLAALVPDSVDVSCVGALPVGLTKPFGVAGDVGLRGYLQLRRGIEHAVETDRPEIVLITGSPYYPMLLAGWIKRRWNIPVVLDFQDPWVSNEGKTRPRWSKGGLSHRLGIWLEPKAIRGASYITSVSDGQNAEMNARYPWLPGSMFSAIPIGGDPEDFSALRGEAEPDRLPSTITMSYVGTALPRSGPLLKTLFQGLALLRERRPDLTGRLHLRFVGTSNQPNETAMLRVLPIAEEANVGDLVSEEPARVPFLDALRTLANTSAVMMIGSDEPHYTASKIYPALMSGRPFLSIFHRASSAHQILSAAGGGIALAFDGQDELGALAPAIAEALERIAANPGSVGKIDQSAYAQYTAHAIAGRYADLFDQATI